MCWGVSVSAGEPGSREAPLQGRGPRTDVPRVHSEELLWLLRHSAGLTWRCAESAEGTLGAAGIRRLRERGVPLQVRPYKVRPSLRLRSAGLHFLGFSGRPLPCPSSVPPGTPARTPKPCPRSWHVGWDPPCPFSGVRGNRLIWRMRPGGWLPCFQWPPDPACGCTESSHGCPHPDP